LSSIGVRRRFDIALWLSSHILLCHNRPVIALPFIFVIRSAMSFLAWEDALNDCLDPLDESVSGAGRSQERPGAQEEEDGRVVEFACLRA